jgi:hypothetical protein
MTDIGRCATGGARNSAVDEALVFAAVPVARGGEREVGDGGRLSGLAAAIGLDMLERPSGLSPLTPSVEP